MFGLPEKFREALKGIRDIANTLKDKTPEMLIK